MKRDDRATGPTYDIEQICWIDFESRSKVDINAGSDRYSRNADAIVLAWATGNDPVQVEAVATFDNGPLRWDAMSPDFRQAAEAVIGGTGIFCAHNANFDRSIWNNATAGFPRLTPHMVIDSRVQASASGLPAALEYAAKFTGAKIQKNPDGKALIKLFCVPEATATPQSEPEAWAAFLAYAEDDIEAMREVFKRSRQLSLAEWREYWTAEKINDRGVTIDIPLVRAAADMAAHDKRLSSVELSGLTNGEVTTVDQVKRIIDWLVEILPSDGRDILTKRDEEIDVETGEEVKPAKRSLTRNRLTRLLAYLDNLGTLTAPLQAAKRVLQIRYYGGSKTPAKFSRMYGSHVGGVLRGQYVFNGASQTGRFSAKGIQVHNLMRDAVEHEIDLIDSLVEGITPDKFAVLGDDTPISRKLSLLIRPSLVAEKGHAFIWGDWANIEARVTPWIVGDKQADDRLKIFAAVDAGTEKYDVYTRTAAELSQIPVDLVTKPLRQRGKVVELACGFGGGTNALLAMAASYGMHLEEVEAKAAVDRWREANPWAQRFWGKHDAHASYGLWGAINKALMQPNTPFPVGRVLYIFLKNYLGGSLLCRLPSGRYLTYRRIKWEQVEDKDEDTGVILSVRRELMFARDMGRVKLWPGLACENIVQAVAADILRGTLVRLEERQYDWMPVRLHTHDEILTQATEAKAELAAQRLTQVMQRGFDWSTGLPIAADTTIGRFYSKNESSWGL